jgi:hypothetical protein
MTSGVAVSGGLKWLGLDGAGARDAPFAIPYVSPLSCSIRGGIRVLEVGVPGRHCR